jgi:hypothetical protein
MLGQAVGEVRRIGAWVIAGSWIVGRRLNSTTLLDRRRVLTATAVSGRGSLPATATATATVRVAAAAGGALAAAGKNKQAESEHERQGTTNA